MYRVVSYFQSSDKTIVHEKTFKSFPSDHFPLLFPVCYPSTIFRQLMHLKRKIQEKLNTRGMGKKNCQVIHIDNFDRSTWSYILSCCQVDVHRSRIVVKNIYLNGDECVVEKWREDQEAFVLTNPRDLSFAQSFLGSAVGIGVRCIIPCQIKSKKYSASVHTINRTERINFVPFEAECKENLRRGLEFKYIPNRMSLTVTIRFRQLVNEREVVESFASRSLPNEEVVMDNSWPFYSTMEVFGNNIKSINLQSRRLCLVNGHTYTIQEAIRYLEEFYY